MNRLAIIALPILFVCSPIVSGQNDSLSLGTFSGILVDDSLGFAIPSVHLWNETSRTGSVSNASGEFSIRAREQDTIVFTAIGYISQVVRTSSLNQAMVVRMKQRTYEINELVVRRFRSYESFIYQVVHHELPENEISETKQQLSVTLTHVAVEADRERAAREKLENHGFSTPLGTIINPNKAFREKILRLEKRKRAIEAKFNRDMVAEITCLEGEELTEFIALCNFSDEYLYQTDLITIIQEIYAVLDEYRSLRN